MLNRLLIACFILLALPSLAQTSATASFASNTFSFTKLKTKIDSLAQVADEMPPMERSVFSGHTKAGRYRVECYFNKATKEILKTNFLIITDSMNYNKIYYYSNNAVIKLNYNNNAIYYQAGKQLYNADGEVVNPASLNKLMDLVNDTWQGLYTAIFQ